MDDYLTNQMANNHIPGMAVAIVRSGKLEKLKTYGRANLEWPTGTTRDTAFQLASATKPLTGTALMLLVQDGKLSLDDPVSKYIPGAPALWQGITIGHLATHTSGLTDVFGQQPVNTVEEAMALLIKKPLAYAPSERSVYAAGDYVVLVSIIERLTAKPFQTFLRERLFVPLGMQATTYDNAVDMGPIRFADPVAQRASVYNWQQNRQRLGWFLFPVHSYGAGGLYSSISDLARWIIALDGGKLLKPESLARMWTAQKLNDGKETNFGVGWVVGTYNGRRTVGHSGGPALADILRFPDENLTIIVLQNQQKVAPYLAQGVADLLLPDLHRPAPKAIEDRDPQISQHLRRLMEDARGNRMDLSAFIPQLQGSDLPDYLLSYLRSLEQLQSFVLVEDRTEGDFRVRQYFAVFGKKPIRWTFTLNREGKVANIGPTTP